MLSLRRVSLWVTISSFFAISALAQVANPASLDTAKVVAKGNLAITGYIDTYYGYNFDHPVTGDNPYLTTANRHNEFDISLAFIDFRYNHPRVRARVAPGFGTFMQSNYGSEPSLLANIMEARAGVKLFKNKEIWLDMGVLGSPFTNESGISKDHLLYTRSLSPEFVPYYVTGAKLTWQVSSKLNAMFYVLNGWQEIRDKDNDRAVATQLEYKPSSKLLLNWNTFIGKEPAALNSYDGNRFFSDIYAVYDSGKKWAATACAYIGMQDLGPGIGNQLWYSANVCGKYSFNSIWSVSGRVDYFHDPNGAVSVLVTDPTKGLKAASGTLGINAQIIENALLRFEARQFWSENNARAFTNKDNQAIQGNTLVTGSLTIWY